MGRGDKKTKKGKISMGSFGNMRPRPGNKEVNSEETAKPAKAEKKPAATKETKEKKK